MPWLSCTAKPMSVSPAASRSRLACRRVAQRGDPGVLGVQRQGHRRLKRRAADVAQILFGRAHPGDEFGWAASPSDLPAGAVEHLGRAGDGDRALGHAVEPGQRQVLAVVKHQVLVDLVGDNQKVCG